VNVSWVLRTGRSTSRPVAYGDLPDLAALKADPTVYALMLGGVRTTAQTAADLAEDIMFWGRHGVGLWAVRDASTEAFFGITGLHLRGDGRGMALRMAAATPARLRVPHSVSDMTVPVCDGSLACRAKPTSGRAWCWARSAWCRAKSTSATDIR
jgi:hypothetical protein